MQISRRLRLTLLASLLAAAPMMAACGVDPEITTTSGTEAPSVTAASDSTQDSHDDGRVGDEPDEPNGSSDLEALEDAQRRWAESGIADYSYTLVEYCECPAELSGPRHVEVRDGAVSATTYQGGPAEFPGYSAEQLFGFARQAIERGAEVVISYNDHGFPVAATLDIEAVAVDGGFSYQTSGFEVGK